MKITKHPIDPVIVIEDPVLTLGEPLHIYIGPNGTNNNNRRRYQVDTIYRMLKKANITTDTGAGFQGNDDFSDGMSGFRGDGFQGNG